MNSESTIIFSLVILLLGYGVHRLVKACFSANLTDWGKPTLNFLDGLNRLFCEKYHRLKRTAIKLPEEGGAILVSNHISGLDPMLLLASTRRPLRFLIAKEQYERFGLKWLFDAIGCIPVDRSGRPEKAFREALRALKNGSVIALFPYGGIHLSHDSVKIKGGASKLAVLSGVDITVAKISGISGLDTVIYAVIARSHASVQFKSEIHVNEKEFKELQNQLHEEMSF